MYTNICYIYIYILVETNQVRKSVWRSVGKQKKNSKKDNSLLADETTRLTTMTEEDEDDSGISIKVININDSKF